MINRYFDHKYAWRIRGLESYRSNATKLSNATILKEKLATYVNGVLQKQLEVKGLLEEDAVMLIAAIEQLVFDNVLESVESSYLVNKVDVNTKLSKSEMFSILQSFLVEGLLQANFSDPQKHFHNKQIIRQIFPTWDTVSLFVEDVVGADAYEANLAASPLSRGSRPTYRFEHTAAIAQRTVEEFGPWFHHECSKMSDALVGMDVHETGRVRLPDFYHSSADGSWHFQESQDYLRQLGALDESDSALGPQVIIPNYVLGVSNCILPGKYYSVCCMNECGGVQDQLEARIRQPRASVSEIADAVLSIFGRNVSVPQQGRNSTLLDDLQAVASVNGGEVPLHSRLFLQWLHFAFPRTCPYPHAAGQLNPETPAELASRAGDEAVVVSDGDLYLHSMEKALDKSSSPTAGAKMWLSHEEHIASDTVHAKQTSFSALDRDLHPPVVALVIAAAFAAGLVTTIRRLVKVCNEGKVQEVVQESDVAASQEVTV
jgi:hypothetical protein